jgi:hypothetical protein
MAQHVDHAPLVELGSYPVGELRLGHAGIAAVALDQLVPGIDLRGSEKGEQLGGVEAPHRIEVAGLALQHVVLDRRVATRAG